MNRPCDCSLKATPPSGITKRDILSVLLSVFGSFLGTWSLGLARHFWYGFMRWLH